MNFRKWLRLLGPGLLYAGAAIGVSHLVQSTRAGANFGFELLGIILLANALKYPFFRFAPQYTAITGKNIIEGYHLLGKWAVWLFFAVSLLSMFVLQAGVSLVTAGLLEQLINTGLPVAMLTFILLITVALLLIFGKYRLLDGLIKYVMLVLVITLFMAVFMAFIKNPPGEIHLFFYDFSLKNPVHLAFLIAFVGWMPAPLDVSVWQSLWTEAKNKSFHSHTDLRAMLTDFHTGYLATIITAIGFLTLGALIMHGSGKGFHSGSVAFAGQLIELFTVSVGAWAFWIIALAAFTTMFSTTLTCYDAYTRVMSKTTRILFPGWKKEKYLTLFWMLILLLGTMIILLFFSRNMKQMVDFATTLSFVLAPVIALLNYLVITGKEIPPSHKPLGWLKVYALLSLIILIAFSIFYLYWKFL